MHMTRRYFMRSTGLLSAYLGVAPTDLLARARDPGDPGEPPSVRRGKTLVVDIWATWCVPCQPALDKLEALAREMRGREDVSFLALSVDADEGVWTRRLAEAGWNNLTHARKPFASAGLDYPGLPYVLIIDANGVVRVMDHFPDVRRELEKLGVGGRK